MNKYFVNCPADSYYIETLRDAELHRAGGNLFLHQSSGKSVYHHFLRSVKFGVNDAIFAIDAVRVCSYFFTAVAKLL